MPNFPARPPRALLIFVVSFCVSFSIITAKTLNRLILQRSLVDPVNLPCCHMRCNSTALQRGLCIRCWKRFHPICGSWWRNIYWCYCMLDLFNRGTVSFYCWHGPCTIQTAIVISLTKNTGRWQTWHQTSTVQKPLVVFYVQKEMTVSKKKRKKGQFLSPTWKLGGFWTQHFMRKCLERLFSWHFALIVLCGSRVHLIKDFTFIAACPDRSGPHRTEDAVKDTACPDTHTCSIMGNHTGKDIHGTTGTQAVNTTHGFCLESHGELVDYLIYFFTLLDWEHLRFILNAPLLSHRLQLNISSGCHSVRLTIFRLFVFLVPRQKVPHVLYFSVCPIPSEDKFVWTTNVCSEVFVLLWSRGVTGAHTKEGIGLTLQKCTLLTHRIII